jgi:signal transduction histidine kinase
LEPRGPSGFTACEARVNRIFRRHRIIGLCSYRLDHCSPEEVIDVVRHHEFGLVRRNGAWEPIQSAALRLRQDELPALDFLSVASHELKTPLASLKLYLEGTARLLRRQPIRPEELARRVARALEQCSRMEILIGNLLEASRARSGRLPVVLEPGDLSELVQRVCARLADELSRRGCALSVHAEVPVYGLWDRLRMDQVLTNLLTNAMKYAPGAPVAVTLEGADGWARLTVRDHGPGIRPEDQAGIFERFRQLAPHAGQGGFGLGLWIVRQAVETLGGTVRVDSAPGNGTAFVVELPCSPPRQQEPG